jgi:polyisoprenoid-binding protein YceI
MTVRTSTEVLDHLTGSYQLDPAHTRLGFAARHALVTRVHGWWDSFEGRLHLDASDQTRSSIALTIDAASIRTNNADRDAHLRSSDFFDVERYQGSCVDPYSQLRVGIEGSGSLKRSDWGLTWNAALEAGGLVLSDRIDLEIDISAIKVG